MLVRVARPVIASIGVHAALVGALGAIVLRHREPVVEPPAEAAPMEVTLIEPLGAAAGGDGGGGVTLGEPALPGAAQIIGTRHGHGTEVGPATGVGSGTGDRPGTAAGHNLMKMRGKELGPVTLSFDPDKHPLPPPVAISGRLHDAGRGAVIPDLVTTVTVDPDGKAHFHDKPDFEIHLQLPIMSRAQFGNMLRKWYEDPYAQTRVGKTQDMSPVDQAVEGTWNSGLSTTPDQQRSGATVPIAGGSFDLTAWAMRKAGVGDPYQARKRAMLDTTRAERAERGGAYRAEQLAKSSEIMRSNLEALWRSTADLAERRQTLFQLWDECTEGEGPQGEAGERARVQVLGWIRAKVPKDGAGAFTAAEIAALDAKRSSKQHFCPYE